MLRDDAIYNSSFRFRNINFNNVNDINLAINIIIVIATTFFKTFIAVIFVLELVIVIVININIVVIIVIVIVIVFFVIVFERSISKLIAFGFDMKNYLAMNASLDKSQNLIIIEIFDRVFLRIDDNVSLF